MTLLEIKPKSARGEMLPEGGYRHLIIALDVSPSMQLKDSGSGKDQSRAARAGEVMMSLLQRIAIEQALTRTAWHQGRAAELLGVSPRTLHRKIRGLGLVRPGPLDA